MLAYDNDVRSQTSDGTMRPNPGMREDVHHKLPVTAVPVERYCADRSAEYEWQQVRDGGSLTTKQCFLFGSPELARTWATRALYFHPESAGGLMALQPRHGWSFIRIPELLQRKHYRGRRRGCQRDPWESGTGHRGHRPGLLRGHDLCPHRFSVTSRSVAGEGNDTTQGQAHLKPNGSTIIIIIININITVAPCEDAGTEHGLNGLL
ncbi:chromatin-remodeling ATPase INO80 [Tachysurus ichikawai]